MFTSIPEAGLYPVELIRNDDRSLLNAKDAGTKVEKKKRL